jgi:hypothetical protein
MTQDQSLDDTLAGFRMSMNLDGLNPRLFGCDLVLSLTPPLTPQQAAGEGCSHIYIPDLGGKFVPPNDETRELIHRVAMLQMQAGFARLEGCHCEIMVSPEGGMASDGYNAFETGFVVRDGPYGRRIDILARYSADDRDDVLSAARRVARSVRFI